MNFERGQDPKKSIGLGPKNIAIELFALAKRVFIKTPSHREVFIAHKKFTKNNTIGVLLKIEKKELSIENYFIINESLLSLSKKLYKKYHNEL